jgi:ABC-type phosphate/phosphonate transport system permease subunit
LAKSELSFPEIAESFRNIGTWFRRYDGDELTLTKIVGHAVIAVLASVSLGSMDASERNIENATNACKTIAESVGDIEKMAPEIVVSVNEICEWISANGTTELITERTGMAPTKIMAYAGIAIAIYVVMFFLADAIKKKGKDEDK